MARIGRVIAAVLAFVFFENGLVGIPSSVASQIAWLGGEGRHVVPPVVAFMVAMILGLVALGPERLLRWWRLLSKSSSDEHADEPSAPVTGRFAFPRTPLERAIAQQIAAAEAIERERRVRGDGGYFDAVVKWAGETSNALRGANAGDLAIQFEQPGIQAPPTVENIGDYMAEKTQLLRDALAQLCSDESPASSKPARQPDRVGLLRDACKEGKRVQTRLVYLTEPNARFEAVCDWARDTWAMLAEHFPHYSQEFYGPGSEALGGSLFPISCQQEIDSLGGYVERYVEKKLALLHDLLKQYDVSG